MNGPHKTLCFIVDKTDGKIMTNQGKPFIYYTRDEAQNALNWLHQNTISLDGFTVAEYELKEN